jgi:hypothetical protein
MTIWRENCASRFEANKAANDVGDFATVSVASKKNALRCSQHKLRHS